MLHASTAVPWYSDPFWAWVGVIAQVLSLVAIGIAVAEVFAQRRRVSPSLLDLEFIGSINHSRGAYHLAEFSNRGTGTEIAVTWTFKAEYYPEDDRRFRSVMGSGNTVQLLITADRIGRLGCTSSGTPTTIDASFTFSGCHSPTDPSPRLGDSQ